MSLPHNLKTKLARTHLLYGECFAGKTDELTHGNSCRAAFDMFENMGAAGFAERGAPGAAGHRRESPQTTGQHPK